MLRTVIVGPSECGKTTLGNTLQKQYAARGIPGLACSIFPHQWPGCVHRWAAPQFLDYVAYAKTARGCVLCIDESGQTVKRQTEAEWIFTTARNEYDNGRGGIAGGHDVICMCHSGSQLTPTMRQQCNVIALFGSSESVCAMWADELNAPELMAAADPAFPQYEFILKRKYQPARRVKLAL